MPSLHQFACCVLAVAFAFGAGGLANGQQQATPARRTTQQVLDQNAEQDRYTFIVFHKGNTAAAQAMTKAVKQGLSKQTHDSTIALSLVSSPAEKPLVDKLGVSRAPMPLCVAIAPNGAVTSLFMKTPTSKEVAGAFVTPTMTRCMKAMQDGKIVLVCVQDGPETPEPLAVQDFQADPEFTDRVATVTLDPTDPAETEFLQQLEMDAENKNAIATIILAPPGVLVGKYTAQTMQAEMTAELHAAGKCCDDPNCKHHKPAGNAKSATKPKSAASRRK